MSVLVPLITEQGRKNLGRVINCARKSQAWSMDDLVRHIINTTGHSVGKATLSALERGNNKPEWDTLAILAASNFIKNPSTGNFYTPEELFKIACELIDPMTGQPISRNRSNHSYRTASEPGGQYQFAQV